MLPGIKGREWLITNNDPQPSLPLSSLEKGLKRCWALITFRQNGAKKEKKLKKVTSWSFYDAEMSDFDPLDENRTIKHISEVLI